MTTRLRCSIFQHGDVKLIRHLPPSLAYPLAGKIGHRRFNHDGQLRRGIEHTWQTALPGSSVEQRQHWSARFCEMLGYELLDAYIIERLQQPRLHHLVEITPGSLETLSAAKAKGRGVILAMAHFNRPNLVLATIANAGHRLGMLTMPVVSEYDSSANDQQRYLRWKTQSLQRVLKGRWISSSDNLRALYRGLTNNECIVILFDAHSATGTRSIQRLSFMNGHLSLPQGLRRLVEKTGCEVVYVTGLSTAWTVQLQIRPLPSIASRVLAAAVDELESDVQRYPWLWWQWANFSGLWEASG